MPQDAHESHRAAVENIRLRPLAEADAPALLNLYNHRDAYSRRCFRALGGETTDLATCERAVRAAADAEKQVDLVAVDAGGRLLGWAYVWKLDTAEPTFGLLVADHAQCRGLGRRLATTVLDVADARAVPEVQLTVVVDNARAIGLYQRLGFIDVGSFNHGDGLDYRRMIRRRPTGGG